jgi:hypothetical protein
LVSLDRRQWLAAVSSLSALFVLDRNGALRAGEQRRGAHDAPLHFAFTPVPASNQDAVVVPAGYSARVFFPWGTPVRPSAPAWSLTSTSEDQRLQAGMHHDGMAFFPVDARFDAAAGRLMGSSAHGYLAINHEYTDEGLLHADGVTNWSAEKVRKSKAAVGVSVLEILRDAQGNQWNILAGRRITALDEIEFTGPARGDALLRTQGSFDQPYERDGTGTEGTLANCAHGVTPWGTYLTCEENFQDYFARSKPSAGDVEQLDADGKRQELRMQRYGIGDAFLTVRGWRSTTGWDQFDPRYDADHKELAHHCHRYGWVVEIDPRDATRKPAKRTALGRFRHENAAVTLAPDGRVVVYMGDDARFEYVYKFVSKDAFAAEEPSDDDTTRRRKREHNWSLFDAGTLYVARFEASDTGRWLELSVEQSDIKKSAQFATQAEVVVFARHAADVVQATKMDRPEWIAVDQDPASRRVRNVYVSLTNNNKRGEPGLPQPDAANPRADNVYGHIVRFAETDGDPTATTFRWSLFVLGGYRRHPVPAQRGTIKDAPGCKDQDFGSPDGLTMDPRGGVLWVQTDVSGTMLRETEYSRLGNNQMLALDVATGEARRFLTGPNGCEITGLSFTPDCCTMFVNVQHPGEAGEAFNDSGKPLAVSRWPDGERDQRPRSATLIVTRDDGGPIGS